MPIQFMRSPLAAKSNLTFTTITYIPTYCITKCGPFKACSDLHKSNHGVKCIFSICCVFRMHRTKQPRLMHFIRYV